MKISRFVNNLRSAKIHTSGYAKTAGDSFGAASYETFAQRKAIDRQRQHVGKYTESAVVGGHKPTAYGVSGYSVDVVSDSKSAAAARTRSRSSRLDLMQPASDSASRRQRYAAAPQVKAVSNAPTVSAAPVTPAPSARPTASRYRYTEPRPRTGGPYSSR